MLIPVCPGPNKIRVSQTPPPQSPRGWRTLYIRLILYCDFGARIDGDWEVVEEPRAEWTKARGWSLANRDLMHLVGEDLSLQLGIFIAQWRKRLAHLHQLPPTLPFEGLLLLLEAAVFVNVGADAEDNMPAGFGGPDQLIKGLGRGVAGGEDTGRYDG